jgi:hypothetical protein
MRGIRTWLAAVGLAGVLVPSARAQVAFIPQVGSFPNGAMMSTTPAVSFDRRYVRLGVNPVFTTIEGFNTFSVPAAVSGGGVGAGGLGGLGLGGLGMGGGGGGLGGGFGGGMVGFAGVNGPMVDPNGAMAGSGFGGRPIGPMSPSAGPSTSSSDFEDQPMRPQAREPQPTHAPLSKKAIRRRKGRTVRVEKPATTARATVGAKTKP